MFNYIMDGITMKKLINICVSAMVDKKVIQKSQCAVIGYGLDLLFSSVLTILSVLLMGLLLSREQSIFWLLFISIPLQSFGGGYHCKTRLRCWIVTVAGYLAALFAAEYLPMRVLWGAAALSAWPFLCLAPVENPRAPFGEVFRGKMQTIVRRVYFVWIVIAGILSVSRNERVRPILAGIIMAGIAVIFAEAARRIRDRRRSSFGNPG